jgi:rare lipoprotein A
VRQILTNSVYALLLLGGTMGAIPAHQMLAPPSAPEILPLPRPAEPVKHVSKKPGDAYQVGLASWYGGFFHGRLTANGEVYDMYDFTAAHLELPLGTYIKVTNLSNHRSVVVRVNDRGPVIPGRILDLSYGAARSLGMENKGVQKIRIDIVKPEQAKLALAMQPYIPQ